MKRYKKDGTLDKRCRNNRKQRINIVVRSRATARMVRQARRIVKINNIRTVLQVAYKVARFVVITFVVYSILAFIVGVII